jgi:hypothetical protein
MRWDNGILLADRRIRSDHPLYLHVQSLLRSHGFHVVRVADLVHPEDPAAIRFQVEDIRAALGRATSHLMELKHGIDIATAMMETLRVYCERYGFDYGQHPDWFNVKERALLAMKDRLFRSEWHRYPMPPAVMDTEDYKRWASIRLEQSSVSGLVKRVVEHYISRYRLVFLRDNPPMIKVFYLRRHAFKPLFTLTAWLADLANRYGSENVPELYTGLLEVLSSPFVPAGIGSVNAVLKRDEYRDKDGSLRMMPYLELDCPCCSARHEYRPANRLSIRELMNVPMRACCFYAPDIWLPLANCTEAEVREFILECAVQSTV